MKIALKVLVTIACLAGVAALAWFAWNQWGRDTIRALITRITVQWRPAPNDGPHPEVQTPLNQDEIDRERRKLRGDS